MFFAPRAYSAEAGASAAKAGRQGAKKISSHFSEPWRSFRLCASHSFSDVLDPKLGPIKFQISLLRDNEGMREVAKC